MSVSSLTNPRTLSPETIESPTELRGRSAEELQAFAVIWSLLIHLVKQSLFVQGRTAGPET